MTIPLFPDDTGAILSPCGLYRYRLWRSWGPGQRMAWGLLNPSKADAEIDDPTVYKLIAFTKRFGFDGFTLVNAFGYRLTDSNNLPLLAKRGVDLIGPENDQHLLEVARAHPLFVCAWGTKGALLGRGEAVRRMLRGAGIPLHYLRLTKDGHPEHVLYLPGTLRPVSWSDLSTVHS